VHASVFVNQNLTFDCGESVRWLAIGMVSVQQPK
jgi:hypothetical protein